MAQFNLENILSELTKIDGPLHQAPKPRWQRKEDDARSRSDRVALSPWKPRLTRTPGKSVSDDHSVPSKTPQKPATKTPKKTPAKTPLKSGQDRFIPNRATTDLDMCHYAVSTCDENSEPGEDGTYQRHLDQVLPTGNHPQNSKLLSYKTKPVPAEQGHLNNLMVLYSTTKIQTTGAKMSRYIPNNADRVLDAPNLLDDYYLNLLDWSAHNQLAVALGSAVYLWNAQTESIAQLLDLNDQPVTSVAWVKEGSILAVGAQDGSVQIWDAGQEKQLRVMSGHAARVASFSWNSHVLSSGSRSGKIHHHDVRVATHHVGTLDHHTQEVCGLSWSPCGRFLASGGNDNLLNLWDNHLGDCDQPLYSFTQHQAAVKALAWCPWQPTLLASGGGTADRHIRFWNTSNGTCLTAVDTNSQVCSILWSKEHKELISGHGYTKNQLSIWKYPHMKKITDLTGHASRILSLCMSPDGTTVASAAADETIRLWKCFVVDREKKSTSTKPSSKDVSSLSITQRGIR
ncbi:cell division cycle protein 20 homolog [Gigantopelta aegis]|uniref:cell division cycle protein 20 homolog n=1 Tax=Gigantopelta aegis TaxID=1735272 RepID=UPI001B88E748|nr:cell division cycle protein 20 homolog [Gigantopelta aegis]